MNDMKVVVKIGYVKLVLDIEPAMELIKLLWGQHVQQLEADYVKDETTGTYGNVYKIKTMSQGEMSVEYLSATNYVAYTLNGDTK